MCLVKKSPPTFVENRLEKFSNFKVCSISTQPSDFCLENQFEQNLGSSAISKLGLEKKVFEDDGMVEDQELTWYRMECFFSNSMFVTLKAALLSILVYEKSVMLHLHEGPV